jgi:RNA polymerase sigma-70 factor (ECF subfamily)
VSEPRASLATVIELPSVEAELVLRAQRGETEARRALFVRFAPELAALLRRIVGRGCEVDDAVQQAFLTAFERLSTLTSPHAFRPWLYTLAIRAARRRVWTQRLREVALPTAEAPPLWRAEDLAPELSADERAQLVLLGQRLSRLPLPLRQAWVLRYQFDCTLPETAAACGCSLATAKRRIEEARQRLEGNTR